MKLFTELPMPESLQGALDKLNFIETTPIQKKAIPLLMKRKDVIACSETGSGKTAAYVLPMLIQMLADDKKNGLILAPTRELAQQINEFVDALLVHEKKFNVVRLVGGTDIRKQFKKLQKKTRLIVATPGRLIDHLKRNTVQLNKTEFLVLDEGDRMIDMGFAPQLKQILEFLPNERQTSFFTATLDEKVRKLAGDYLHKPEKVTIGTASRPVSAIKQDVMQVQFADKDECVVNELNVREGSVIVFLKTKYRTDRLTQYLLEYGFDVDQIHGGRTQGQRNKAIRNFKSGKTRILCATDVAARGIDVPQVAHVINFDLPMMAEDYVHRIGRTARNGAQGEALSFVTPEEHRYWNKLVRVYNITDAMLPETAPKKRGAKKSSSRGATSRRGAKGKRSSERRRGDDFGEGRSKRKSSAKRGSSKRDSFSEGSPKRSSGKRKPYSEESPKRSLKGKKKSATQSRAKTVDKGSTKKVSFKKKKSGKKFKKSGGFKKSRARQRARA